jgi:peptidoglycan/LPS O-acetylase OafA/YrhL
MGDVALDQPGKLRLRFIDGLRGLAALYVLVFHFGLSSDEAPGNYGTVVGLLRRVLGEGHLAVVLFIVLSGFSLMLPIARSGTGRLTTSLLEFARRRVRRILPAYYAALALGLVLVLTYVAVASAEQLKRQPASGVLEPGTIISHLLLFHNLKFAWAYKINAPLWSIATEWQIYFVFVLLLLPLFRRLGAPLAVVVAWTLGSLPHALLPEQDNFFWACPWFLGAFALGMWSANICFSPKYADSFWRQRAPWGVLTLVAAGLFALGWQCTYAWKYILRDAALSVVSLCLINYCVRRVQHAQPGPLLRLFESRWVVFLGSFSYSLYAIQHPLLIFVKLALSQLHLSRDASFLLQLVCVTPLVLAISWVFAELFERPLTGGGVLLPALRERFTRHAESAAR